MPHKDPEERRKYLRLWAEKNKDKVKQYEKTRYAKHKEKRSRALLEWQANNRDRVLEAGRRWSRNNKAAVNAKNSKRRASLINATPAWLTEFDLLRMKCIYQVAEMRTNESGEDYHVDHIVPLRGKEVCGLHVPWNLHVIPAKENMQKGNRLWH